MDNLFRIRVLTQAVNKMRTASTVLYDRFFRPRANMQSTDRLAFDIISGSEAVLKNISIYAPAEVTDKTSRKTVTLQAPRLAQKRFIHTSELNALRAYGAQASVEMMESRIARELMDMRAMHDRTLEYWAANALRGKIYDADGVTVLVDYGMATSHKPTLTGDDLWTSANSDPINRLRAFQQTIEDDSGAPITSWYGAVGSQVMDALLSHAGVRDLLKYTQGPQLATTGRVAGLAGVELEEYNASYLTTKTVGTTTKTTRKRFIEADHILLVGMTDDLVDCPYAPVVDSEAPGGVGNSGAGEMFFSKSWEEKDPSGRWVKTEARPLPVLQRPDCVIYAKVV